MGMGPKRKKSRQNSHAPVAQPALTAVSPPADPAQQSGGTATDNKSPPVESSSAAAAKPSPSANAALPPSPVRSSWYGGSWRLKASPLTETARESISVAQGVTSEALAESGKQIAEASKRPGQYVARGMRGSRKSIPLVAEATRVHATSDASDKSRSVVDSGEKLKGFDGPAETKGDVKELKDVKDSKDVKEMKDNEDAKGTKHTTNVKGMKDPNDVKGMKDSKDTKNRKDSQEIKDTKNTTNKKNAQDTKDTKHATESQQVVEEAPLPPEPAVDAASTEDNKSTTSNTWPQSGSWFGWWSRPDDYDSSRDKPNGDGSNIDEASGTPLPGTPNNELVAASETQPPPDTKQKDAVQLGAGETGLQPEKSAKTGSARSWFGLWSSAQNQQAAEEELTNEEPAQEQPPEITVSAEPSKTAHEADAPAKQDKSSSDERPSSSGWAFWSTDKTKDAGPTPGGTQRQIGELAVADTPSQSHPEAAQFNEQQDGQTSKAQPKRTGSLLRPKRGRGDKQDLSGESGSNTPTPSPSPGTPVTESAPKDDSDVPKPVQRGKVTLQSRPNSILPSFVATYPPAPTPSYLERVTQYVAETLRIADSQASSRHIYRSPTKPKIKKAISLGIHGFFPAPLIQRVLGQPTGTSIRFANYGAASIKSWCQENQPEIKDVEIEKVALEGEGFVADRVNTLWKLMLNWLSHLRQADFILVCCHSQGVPVSLALIAKLIQLGCLHPHAKIGVCAMAGINLGPFLDYKSRLFGGSALELFDFCDSSSKVSQAYAESLDVCLRHGVRVTYIGSLDDQLVSLESSLHTPLSHPYVNRAVFVDGRLHAPNFLIHLVVFALKLRNLGVSDHGLIRELSAPLAGSLVGGEGHSRVYDDPAVYRLAIDFALESTNVAPPFSSAVAAAATEREKAKEAAFNRRSTLSGYPSSTAAANSMRRGSLNPSHNLPGIGAVVAPYEPPPTASNANPFFLPWAVRGMLEEALVKRDMMDEVRELVAEFDAWKPTSKVLKDVRWRLEAVKQMV